MRQQLAEIGGQLLREADLAAEAVRSKVRRARSGRHWCTALFLNGDILLKHHLVMPSSFESLLGSDLIRHQCFFESQG